MFGAMLLFTLALQIENRCNDGFFQNSWALLREARYGHSQFERAAFAVRTSDGRVEFVRWPVSPHALRADFEGAIPPNAFAIVHTHPNSCPVPSADDEEVALRLHIPVYVVTRAGLARTTGRQLGFVSFGDWNPERCSRR